MYARSFVRDAFGCFGFGLHSFINTLFLNNKQTNKHTNKQTNNSQQTEQQFRTVFNQFICVAGAMPQNENAAVARLSELVRLCGFVDVCRRGLVFGLLPTLTRPLCSYVH